MGRKTDFSPQKHEKKYSTELLKNLIKNEKLKFEYIDFVFNVHLKEINMNLLLTERKVEAIKQRIRVIGKSLISFSSSGAFNFRCFRPVLNAMPNIQRLELEYSNCDDAAIQVIANHCPLLTKLNVYATLVSDVGMQFLCFPEQHRLCLKYLNASRTYVKASGALLILKNIPSIQILTHENLSRTVSDAIARNELSENEILNLTLMEIHNAKSELQPISKVCPNVKRLFVKNIDSPTQILNCYDFKKLEDVGLFYASGRGPGICIDDFLKFCGSHIINLALENFILSVNILAQSCPNLKILELYDPTFAHSPPTHGHAFLNLTHLKIYGCSLLSDKEVKSPASILKSSPNLKSLSLLCCLIGTLMENVILNCCGPLVQINFSESLVSSQFLQEILLKHSRLQCLIIENSGLRSDDHRDLLDLTELLNHPINILWY